MNNGFADDSANATPKINFSDDQNIQLNPHKQGSEEIDLGDMTIEVVRSLGRPKGQIDKDAENRKLLYYPRGLVDLKDDRVFEYKLMSQEQIDAREQRRLAERAERDRKMEELKQAMLKEAAEEIARVKEDENFETMPASKRVAFWRSFQKKYPGAPMDSDSYRQAMVEYNEYTERKAMEDELARLKAEVEANDPGPKPRLSSKRIKKMKRAGTWKWSEEDEDE